VPGLIDGLDGRDGIVRTARERAQLTRIRQEKSGDKHGVGDCDERSDYLAFVGKPGKRAGHDRSLEGKP
jgi:hypothetical protein